MVYPNPRDPRGTGPPYGLSWTMWAGMILAAVLVLVVLASMLPPRDASRTVTATPPATESAPTTKTE